MNSALQYERFDMPHMYIGPILKIHGLLPRRQMAAILDWPLWIPPALLGIGPPAKFLF